MARIRKSIAKYEFGSPSTEDKRRDELYGDLSKAFITGTTALANIGTFKENEVLQGVGQGSQLGGSIGSIFGPVGGAIGVGLGAIGGAAFGAAQKRKREAIEERQRMMQRAGAIEQFKNLNTFGLDFGQSPITFADGTPMVTVNPLGGMQDEFVPVNAVSKETKAYYTSQTKHNEELAKQYYIAQLNELIKGLVEPANNKEQKSQTVKTTQRDISRSSGKAKKFFYEDGGVAAQLEKRNGVVESILTPQNVLVDSNATTTHDNQDPRNVTDIIQPGSQIYSAKKYKNNSIGIAAKVAKDLGVDIDSDAISKILSKQPSKVSPAEIANLAKKYQTKNTVNSFDTDMLKQRSLSRITDIATQINTLVSPTEQVLTQLPNNQQVPKFADGTDGCAGQTAKLKGIMVGGKFAWEQVTSCGPGCVTDTPDPGTVGQVIDVPCRKADESTGSPTTPKKDQDSSTNTPANRDCYTNCVINMTKTAAISPEVIADICRERCKDSMNPPGIPPRQFEGLLTSPPVKVDPKRRDDPYAIQSKYPNEACIECMARQTEKGVTTFEATKNCEAYCKQPTKSENNLTRNKGISPDTLNFALANSANIFNLMKTRQQQMYPYVHTPFKKTDTVPISTADHILSNAYPLMQDYMRSGSPAGLAMSMQAYNSALQGRNEYVTQLQNINKNIDVQNTSAFNRNAELNATNFSNWNQDATALSNAKLMAGPEAMAKAAENSQAYVNTIYKRLYEKQLSDYLQKSAGLPAGSFPTISLPAWMYQQNV